MPFNNKARSNVSRTGLAYLAERTGLEPATPGVTGRYSNQLNYRSSLLQLTGRRWLIPAGTSIESRTTPNLGVP
ncbi:hypothetical protein BGLA2_420192 [Burkholderia gladioli]|nr:hypothetical protein BGLA2_420192 [Burkholderia gladioli]